MVYIQKNEDGIPHHFDCASALYGAIQLGLGYKLVSFEEVQSGKWDNLIKTNVFVGSVEFMTEVFSRVGIEQPRLPLNNLRPEQRVNISDFQFEKNVFIKPTSTKLFTGLVVDEYLFNHYKKNYPDAEIIVQDVIHNIEAEWRVYIYRNRIKAAKNYSGNEFNSDLPRLHHFVTQVLANPKLEDFPESFTIDVGFFNKGQHPLLTLKTVIEFNDMWAIGNYGLENDTYMMMLKNRYFDIIKRKK